MAGWNTTDIDWTSAATLEPTLARQPYLVLYDIAEALRERSPTLDSVSLLAAVRRNDKRKIVRDIDAKYEEMYTKFADHTDNSGVWNDEASIPMWTEANLETQTGLSRPDSPMRGDRISPDWAFWMYSAINLLLWTVKGQLVSSVSWNRKDADDATWADAITAFNAASWSGWSSYGAYSSPAFHQAYLYASSYVIIREAFRLDALAAPTSQYYMADVYTQFKTGLIIANYENNDYAAADGNLYRVYSDAVRRLGALPQGTVEVGYIDECSITTEPTGFDGTGWETGQAANSWQLIRKYDVAGGFDYVAP